MKAQLVAITVPQIEGISNAEQIIAYCARVSSPDNQLNVDTSAKLLTYCLKNGHWSVFEMADMTVHIETSLAIATQILRHKSFCLSGDNFLYFEQPTGMGTANRQLVKKTIKEVHDKFHYGAKPFQRRSVSWKLDKIDAFAAYSPKELSKIIGIAPENIRTLCQKGLLKHIKNNDSIKTIKIYGQDVLNYALKSGQQFQRMPMKNIVQKMGLRFYNPDKQQFDITHIKDIWKSGKKNVFRIHAHGGYSIDVTDDHQILTNDGYKSIKEALDVKITSRGVASFDSSKQMMIACNGQPCYQDKEWMKLQREAQPLKDLAEIAKEANCTVHTIRKWLKLHNLSFSKQEIRALLDRAGIWNKGRSGYSVKRTGPYNGYKTQDTWDFMKTSQQGTKNPLWRGGVSKERAKIQADIAKYRKLLILKYDSKCGLCDKALHGTVHLHHIVPVSENAALAREFDNLMPVHKDCHMKHHSKFGGHKKWRKKSKGNSLTVTYRKVEKIEFLGVQEVYDLEVESEHHNFVCNGVVVHNCFQQFSGRYAKLKPGFEEISPRSPHPTNRQLSVDNLEQQIADKYHELLANVQNIAWESYEKALEMGVAKEVARFLLPLSTTTSMYMKGSVRSWLTYFIQRLHPSTQLEHRQVAQECFKIFKNNFSVCAEILKQKHPELDYPSGE